MTLLVDPASGRGAVGRTLPALETALRAHGFAVTTIRAAGGDELTRLTRETVAGGAGFVAAVGGDGTFQAVLNGWLEHDRPADPDAVLALLAAGSGADAVRTFGLSQRPEEAAARLAVGNVYSIDVVKATVAGDDGRERVRYVLNHAQVGMGGAVARRARGLPSLLGRTRELAAYWATMATYRRPAVRIAGDRREFEGRITNLLVANLQWMSNGVLASPRSWPEDGFVDLQVFTGPKSDSFTMLPKMFQGEHLPHPNVLEYRSRTVRVDCATRQAVEGDGEPIGWTPARFDVLPRVLRLKV